MANAGRNKRGEHVAHQSPSPIRSHNEMEYRELLAEYQALQKKMDGKIEALLCVSEELAKCQADRDQWRQKAENFHHQNIQLEGAFNRQKKEWSVQENSQDEERVSLLAVLNGMKKENRFLQEENTALRQQLKEAKGDIKVLRQQTARLQLANEHFEEFTSPSRASVSSTDNEPCSPEQRHSVRHQTDSEEGQLEETEKLREQCSQMDRDLRSVLCEKEELVSERETYKGKCERLSKELAYIMTGDENRIVADLDSIIAENRYVKAQLANAVEETGLAKQALNKYRTLFDKRRTAQRTGSAEFVLPAPGVNTSATGKGSSYSIYSSSTSSAAASTPTVVTPKQVRDLLGDAAMETTDYRALSTALFEAVNDKSLALTHQRKINKVLGLRVTELESRLRSIEERSPGRIVPASVTENSEPVDPVNSKTQ